MLCIVLFTAIASSQGSIQVNKLYIFISLGSFLEKIKGGL
jgi:hypothetical protein